MTKKKQLNKLLKRRNFRKNPMNSRGTTETLRLKLQDEKGRFIY